MVEKNKPEVYLEVSSGFFRIPTDAVNYNITVLTSGESVDPVSVSISKAAPIEVTEKEPQVTEETDEQIGSTAPAEPVEEVANTESLEAKSFVASPVEDSYYKMAALHFSDEFGRLTAGLDTDESSDSANAPNDAAAAQLQSINSLVGEAKESLLEILEIPGVSSPPEVAADDNKPSLSVDGLKDSINKAKDLISEIAENQNKQPAAPAEPPAPKMEIVKKTRYLFELDTVFQTIYELCTNETVKDHSQAARAKAGEIFNYDTFLDCISPKAAKYVEDDGFYSVPMVDIFVCLVKACSDKKTINLLKNMNKQQADIFLDQFLPLSIPPTEEVEIEVEGAPVKQEEPVAEVAEDTVSPILDKLTEIMDATLADVDKLVSDSGSASEQPAFQEEIIGKVSDTSKIIDNISSGIQDAESKLSGADAQVTEKPSTEINKELQSTAAKMAACLALKERDPGASFSETGDNIEAVSNPVEPEIPDPVEENITEEDIAEIAVAAEEETVDPGATAEDELLEAVGSLEEDAMLDEESEDKSEPEISVEDLGDLLEPAQEDKEENSSAEETNPVDDDDDDDEFGEASQDDIDKLLETMGG